MNDVKTSKDVIVGAVFGRWTVLETNVKNPNSKAKHPPRTAKCQCQCGVIRYKEYRDLYSGRSLSCGCFRGEQLAVKNAIGHEIIMGTRFGKLVAMQDLGMRKQNSRNKNERWTLCRCDCGIEVEVRNNNLKTDMTNSCGCVKSYGEDVIGQLLNQNNISFAKEYIFNDLKGVRGGALRFDFAIFKNEKLIELIEFDGRQHIYGPEGNWTSSYTLDIIQDNDKRKDEYCQEHGIKLLRVPYYHLSKIDLKYLQLDNYHLLNKE